MKLKILKSSIFSLGLLFGLSANAGIINIDFNEEVVSNNLKLDSTDYFSEFGIEFKNKTLYSNQLNFIDENSVIYNGKNKKITALWEDGVSDLSLNWISTSRTIKVNAFDVNNVFLEQFVIKPTDSSGLLNISYENIGKIVVKGNKGEVAINSMSWNDNKSISVSEPSTLFVFALSLLMFGTFRKRKQKTL